MKHICCVMTIIRLPTSFCLHNFYERFQSIFLPNLHYILFSTLYDIYGWDGSSSKAPGWKPSYKNHRSISPTVKKPPRTETPRNKIPPIQKAHQTICPLWQISPCYKLMILLCRWSTSTYAHTNTPRIKKIIR